MMKLGLRSAVVSVDPRLIGSNRESSRSCREETMSNRHLWAKQSAAVVLAAALVSLAGPALAAQIVCQQSGMGDVYTTAQVQNVSRATIAKGKKIA